MAQPGLEELQTRRLPSRENNSALELASLGLAGVAPQARIARCGFPLVEAHCSQPEAAAGVRADMVRT